LLPAQDIYKIKTVHYRVGIVQIL